MTDIPSEKAEPPKSPSPPEKGPAEQVWNEFERRLGRNNRDKEPR